MPPLKEFSFIKRVPTNNKTLAMVLRDWGLFVLGIGLIFVVISIFLTWAISSYKRASYTQEITKIYRDKLPSHIKLNKKSQIPKPVVEGDNKKIITEIVEGISELLKLAMMLREDYDSGGLIMSHQRYLLDNIYSIKDIFKTHLGQRMNQAVENNEIRVTKEDLAAFYTAGYLYAYDYNALLRHLKSPAQKEPVVAVDG